MGLNIQPRAKSVIWFTAEPRPEMYKIAVYDIKLKI